MKIHTIVPLIVIGCVLMASVGYTQKATDTQQTTQTTVDFVDCTGTHPVTRTVQMPHDQWHALQRDLNSIRASGPLTRESFTAQVHVLQTYHLLSSDVAADALYNHVTHRAAPRTIVPIINNSNINAMCAISVTLNGTTVVLGLNSFVNVIGFDIVSVHYGNATSGIQTTGLVSKTSPPGAYAGFMFGFLGYWVGTREKVGVYSDLTAVGFTVITAWVPIS